MDNQITPARLPGFLYYLLALIGTYLLLITYFSFLKILTYKSSFDLAVFDQAFWSMLHTGIPLVTTQPPFEKLNDFGWHFSPIFYLFLPVYALYPSPFTLQIIQCLCLASTAIPVAMCLREIGLNDKLVLGLTAIFLFNPFYFNAALWDFHEAAISCPLMAWSYWALLKRHKAVFCVCLFLLLLTKEHFGLSLAGFGFLWWWRYRDGKFGLIIAFLGLAGLVLILKVIMPTLLNASHPMLNGNDAALSRYTWLGHGKSLETFSALLFSPDIAVVAGISYIFALLFGFAFLPLFSSAYLLPAIADFCASILSGNPMHRSLLSYHSVSMVPVLVIAAGYGLLCLQNTLRKEMKLLPILAILALFQIILYSPPAGIGVYAYELEKPSSLVACDTVKKIRSLVNQQAVSVQPNIGFLFAERPAIYHFPSHIDRSDFLILYLNHPYTEPSYNPFNSLYSVRDPKLHFLAVLALMETEPKWKIALWENNWLVLRRGNGQDLPYRREIIEKLRALADRS